MVIFREKLWPVPNLRFEHTIWTGSFRIWTIGTLVTELTKCMYELAWFSAKEALMYRLTLLSLLQTIYTVTLHVHQHQHINYVHSPPTKLFLNLMSIVITLSQFVSTPPHTHDHRKVPTSTCVVMQCTWPGMYTRLSWRWWRRGVVWVQTRQSNTWRSWRRLLGTRGTSGSHDVSHDMAAAR